MDYMNLAGRKPEIIDCDNFFKSAVMLPIANIDGKECILFEVRADTIKRQPSEICFPGGGMEDTDKGSMDTAERETSEELGLTRRQMDIIAPLDIVITPFNFMIFPYIGKISDYKSINPSAQEVKEVFSVPIDFFKQNKPKVYHVSIKMDPPDDFPYNLIPGGYQYKWHTSEYPEYFYIYNEYVIWGLTARILINFLRLTK